MVLQGHIEDGVVVLDSPTRLAEGTKVEVSVPVSDRNQRAIELVDRWMADDSGYDERVWPQLKENLDRNRAEVGERRLFDE